MFDPAHPYGNRDSRLKNSIYMPNAGQEWKYLNACETDQNKSNIYKGTFAGIVTGYSTISDQDIPILQFADVLLMYAEAQNEATGPTADAYSAINAVRKRSGQPDLPAGLSQDQFRQRLRNERRVELALEGQRYFDLKWWKIEHIVLPQITNSGGTKRNFLPKHYYFPIPQSEVDILKNTQGIDIQNPNYK
ncbi:MAG: RagB/SusD family nutrient uptake outer membrane protein [Flavisolibacter sp.]|nr:RagB/SusD family nutrient uptake outer membrane protein [Flavisolibacter sp.]